MLFLPWQNPQEPGTAHPGLSWRPRRLPAPWHKLLFYGTWLFASELTSLPTLASTFHMNCPEMKREIVQSHFHLWDGLASDTSRRQFLSNGQLGGADSLRAGHLLPTLWLRGALGWTFPRLPGPLPLQASS